MYESTRQDPECYQETEQYTYEFSIERIRTVLSEQNPECALKKML